MTELLAHYLKAWNLSDPQPLAETVTSYVYTVSCDGERVVLKILTDIGTEERVGGLALRHFNGHGAVRLLREDDSAHLMEYAGDEDLVGMSLGGEDEKATDIIADVLNQLHAAPTDHFPEGLYHLRRWFRSLLDGAKKDRENGLDTMYMRAAPLAERLLNEPLDEHVLHGDMHHGNVRHHPQRGWLAFDPKGLVGERTYDAANTLCNPIEAPELVANEARFLRNVEILSDKMKIDRTRILEYTFAYASLSTRWMVDSNIEADMTLKVAQMAEAHLHKK